MCRPPGHYRTWCGTIGCTRRKGDEADGGGNQPGCADRGRNRVPGRRPGAAQRHGQRGARAAPGRHRWPARQRGSRVGSCRGPRAGPGPAGRRGASPVPHRSAARGNRPAACGGRPMPRPGPGTRRRGHRRTGPAQLPGPPVRVRRREISARRRSARRELEAAEQRLEAAEMRADHTVAFIEVSATLEAGAATSAEIEVSYHVRGASWRPLYDLTLEGERLAVSYLAEVWQQSGEDWPAVELILSTTRRGLHQALPELDPWYIGRARPVPAPYQAMTMRKGLSAARAAAGPADDNEMAVASAAAVPLAAHLTAEPAQSGVPGEPGDLGSGLVYRVQRPLAVPADGEPYKTMVAQFALDAELDHLSVQVVATEAYARATVTNTSSLLLLPGPARVFHGPQFVGETVLETVAAGEEFELQLGVDDQIRVERQLRRRSTSKAMIGGTRTIDVGYEITVENHRPGQARISVHDHIPVSSDGDIKVRLREASPDPAGQTDLGELTWDLSLEAGQTATIRYRFTVEHPAQVTVAGL